MKRSVRLADVAKAARVSQGTASNVFNRPEIVRAEVRDRVEKWAQKLGYSGPDPKGRLLRAGRVNAIGILAAKDMSRFFNDPFQRLLMAGIAEVCDEHGAGIALVSATSGRDSAAWTVATALVDGFIVHCLEDGNRLTALVQKRNLPFVTIDLATGPRASSVLIDDQRGAGMAARHLLGLGHRRIGLLCLDTRGDGRFGPLDAERLRSARYKVVRDRVAGYAAALAARGIDLERLPMVEVPNDRQVAVGYAGELLDRAPDTTAIIAMSDVLALAAIEAARQRGRRVPDDLSVIGFDDVPDAALATPPLTTIAQPIADKGRHAARLIFELIFEDGPQRNEILRVKLVERASTARCRVSPRRPSVRRESTRGPGRSRNATPGAGRP